MAKAGGCAWLAGALITSRHTEGFRMAVNHEALAQRLRDAYHTGAVPPLRDGIRPDDADGAYAVQLINTKFWITQGRRVIGRKVGLTSEAVQRQLGVDQPDFGVLFDDMLVPNGGTLDVRKVLQPKIEAEIALTLGKDLVGTGTSVLDVLAATEYALPALEIVDSRITDWRITFADTVADNASSAFFVLSSQPCRLSGLDLLSCGMVMEVDGRVASTGVGAACLGHPLNAAAWLARALAARNDPLRAGDVIMTGALGPMVALKPGMSVRATIGGLGNVSLNVGCVE
jgi:2-keto-4-pentenoate hydratase